MRSLSVSKALSAGALAGALLVSASVARADDKQACSAAYDATQALRTAGKLQEARQQAGICLRDVCAEFVRADCAKWVGELDASQPTVVFEIKDRAGKDTTAVRVSLDGKPWLTTVDGKSKAIDPGAHTLRYEIDGAPAVEVTVQVREGEKNRALHASFEKTPQPGLGGPAAPPPEEKRSIAPWVIGGVGVASLIMGGITGALVLSKRSDFDAHCKGTPLACDPQGQSDASGGKTLGTLSTVGLVVGAVGVGTATVWILTRKPAKPASPTVGLSTSASPTGGGWQLVGTW